ncbi:pilin [Patescibacteria group bacterium]|nr:pilin [Patescibacteria group bacterium]
MAQLPNRLLAVKYTIDGPGLVPTDGTDATLKLEKFVSQIIGVLSLVGVLYFIIQIIFAGYGFLSSKGDEKAMEANRDRLTNGVLGLFIIIVALGLGTLISKLAGIENPLDLNQMFVKMGLQ